MCVIFLPGYFWLPPFFSLSLIDTIKWRLIHYVDALYGSSCCRKNVHQSQKAIWKGKGQTRVEPKETPSSKLKSWLLFECCLLSCWPHTNSMDHNSSCVILYVPSNCLVNCTYVWEGVQEYILHVWWNGTDQKKNNFFLFRFSWIKSWFSLHLIFLGVVVRDSRHRHSWDMTMIISINREYTFIRENLVFAVSRPICLLQSDHA